LPDPTLVTKKLILACWACAPTHSATDSSVEARIGSRVVLLIYIPPVIGFDVAASDIAAKP
jgi:hypothetical protein